MNINYPQKTHGFLTYMMMPLAEIRNVRRRLRWREFSFKQVRFVLSVSLPSEEKFSEGISQDGQGASCEWKPGTWHHEHQGGC